MAAPSTNPIEPVEHIESDQPIIAYRCWSLSPIELLSSAATPSMSWPRLHPMHAMCLAQNAAIEHHEAPAEDHSCGIYAMKTVEALAKTFHYHPQVIGRVALWGEVIEHEDGYRAEYAYPQVFFYDTQAFPKERVQKLADQYGCEISPMPKELIGATQQIQSLSVQSSNTGYIYMGQANAGSYAAISAGSMAHQNQAASNNHNAMLQLMGNVQNQHSQLLQQLLAQSANSAPLTIRAAAPSSPAQPIIHTSIVPHHVFPPTQRSPFDIPLMVILKAAPWGFGAFALLEVLNIIARIHN